MLPLLAAILSTAPLGVPLPDRALEQVTTAGDGLPSVRPTGEHADLPPRIMLADQMQVWWSEKGMELIAIARDAAAATPVAKAPVVDLANGLRIEISIGVSGPATPAR